MIDFDLQGKIKAMAMLGAQQVPTAACTPDMV